MSTTSADKQVNKILTFLWHEDRDEKSSYNVTVWVPDPKEPKTRYIPKQTIPMTFPMTVANSFSEFCFVTSPKKELWMTALHLPAPGQFRQVMIFKIAPHLDVTSWTTLGSQNELYFLYKIINGRDCTLVRPPPFTSSTDRNWIWTQPPDSKEWKKLQILSDSPKWQLNQDGLLIYPGNANRSAAYAFHLQARGKKGGAKSTCELFLDTLHTSYLADWARGECIRWKSVQVELPPDGLFQMNDPWSTCSLVTCDNKSGKSVYFLYIFLRDFARPDAVIYFYVSLRSDGSINTLNNKVQAQGIQTIPVKISDNSPFFRIEEAHGRVFCFWNQDQRVTGKSAEIGNDGIIKNEWLDICDPDKRPRMGVANFIGSAVVPGNFCFTPDEDYKPTA